MARLLRPLLLITGVSCVAIGVLHLLLGIASVPGEQRAGATVDSRERFYAAIFLGYGVAWIWTARQSPVPATLVRWLAAVIAPRRDRAPAVDGGARIPALVPDRADCRRGPRAAGVPLAVHPPAAARACRVRRAVPITPQVIVAPLVPV